MTFNFFRFTEYSRSKDKNLVNTGPDTIHKCKQDLSPKLNTTYLSTGKAVVDLTEEQIGEMETFHNNY